MNTFYKFIAGALITVILCLSIEKNGKEHAVLLSICACCMILGCVVTFMSPVLEFFKKIESVGNLNAGTVQIICKAAGIGLLTEFSSVICVDAGNQALSKSIQLLGSGVILWLSIPLFEQILEILQSILSST